MARKVDIEFVNGECEVVADSVKGRPCVSVTIMGPNGIELCRGQWALVDTGSDGTIVSEALLLGQPSLTGQKIIVDTQHGPLECYSVSDMVLEIADLDDRVPITIKTRKSILPCIDVVIGRDLLARYRMVYDPGSRECTLEAR